MSDRYSRQVRFDGIGSSGQELISQSRVAIVGCGALGTVSSELLARAGVGTLRVIDRDFVELSNLQRQTLFTETDVSTSMPKAIAAETALSSINSEINIEGIVADVTFENIEDFCSDFDLIIDGSDNFEVRFLINDFSVKHAIPWIYGAAVGSFGIAFPIVPGTTPCLACLFENPPPSGTTETCDTAGVVAPITHVVASFQVTQAMRLMTGAGPRAEILQVDVWNNDWRVVQASSPSPSCSCCGQSRFRFLNGEGRSLLTRLCGREAVQVYPTQRGRVNLQELGKRLAKAGEVQSSEHMLRARINSYEIALFPDGRAIIRGTEDFTEARAIYSRYIGN